MNDRGIVVGSPKGLFSLPVGEVYAVFLTDDGIDFDNFAMTDTINRKEAEDLARTYKAMRKEQNDDDHLGLIFVDRENDKCWTLYPHYNENPMVFSGTIFYEKICKKNNARSYHRIKEKKDEN